MSTITTKDGVEIFYKDWGPKNAQPIVFHHGWPLSADDWDTQMLYFVQKGYRVIAHDRRGHGRSSQVSDGHDMDHYAADAAAVVAHLDLRNAIHIGHSTGGGEATHYVARHGKGRVAKLVLIGAVPPIMVKTSANPGGLPIEVFDGLRQQLAANRAQFYRDFVERPLLQLQPAGCEGVSRRDRELVAPGDDGRCEGALRRHQGLLGDGLHRGPEDHRCADARHAWRRRPDRPDRRFRAALREAPQERHPEGLREVPARHVHDACRRGQCRPSRLHQELNWRLWLVAQPSQTRACGPRTRRFGMKIVVIGGSGLIGSKTVAILRQGGHDVFAASPNTGVNTITGEGLKEAMAGTQVVIDLSNSPSFESNAVLEFFETSGRNLLAAEGAAGARHHVALSIVGTDRTPDNGYFRAKVAQENLIKASGIPYTIIRSTQFFEFLGGIAASSTDGSTVRLSPGMFQPIAADDVAAITAEVAIGPPRNGTVEIAGPERVPFNEMVARYLKAIGDPRTVVSDPEARYFGGRVEERSLVPLGEARLGSIDFSEWLRRSQART